MKAALFLPLEIDKPIKNNYLDIDKNTDILFMLAHHAGLIDKIAF